MEPKQRQQILLGALLVVLAGVLAYRYWPLTPASEATLASNGRGVRAGSAAASHEGASAVEDVHLENLDAERPEMGKVERDLFRFKPKAAPPPPPSAARPGGGEGAGAAPPPPVPTGPPPPPPITLKFIGIVESGGAGPRIAVLTDGRGVYQGKEGETIEGRYRILRIGTESIEMAYLDGRGRQTIRLTGQ